MWQNIVPSAPAMPACTARPKPIMAMQRCATTIHIISFATIDGNKYQSTVQYTAAAAAATSGKCIHPEDAFLRRCIHATCFACIIPILYGMVFDASLYILSNHQRGIIYSESSTYTHPETELLYIPGIFENFQRCRYYYMYKVALRCKTTSIQ